MQENLLSESSSPTWPTSAIGGPTTASELPTWARLTDGSAGSASPPSHLLPTPSAQESTPTEDYVDELREHLDPDDPHHRLWLPGRKWMAQRTLSRTVPTLLPTPSASDSTGAELETRKARQKNGTGGGSLRDLPLLLPEAAADAERRRREQHDEGERGVPLAGEGGVPDRLLPTPVVTDSFGSRRSTARTEDWKSNPGTSLTDAIWETQGRETDTRGKLLPNLLPTPTAEDGERGHAGAGTDRLGAATFDDVRLLPTPAAADGDGGRMERGAMGNAGQRPSGHKATLPLPTAVEMREEISGSPFAQAGPDGQLVLLPTPTGYAGDSVEGQLTTEVAMLPTPVGRWELVLDRDAPAPTDEKGRLDPPFVEWMLGYPEGWFDVEGVSRTRKLRALGNSVQVQCAEAVGHWFVGLVESGLLLEDAR